MTDRERLWTALALALFFHFILLRQDGLQPASRLLSAQPLRIELESLLSHPSRPSATTLGAFAEPAAEPANTADTLRKIFLAYLEAISHEVHSRRLDNEQPNLIGVASFSFLVSPQGRFEHIRLEESSGKADLDAAALRAIQRASGVLKRPPVLGSDPLPVFLQVKYQYGLK